MSNCIIKRNSNNQVIGAETPTGEKSLLFEAVNSNIFLPGGESSALILSSIYTPAMEAVFKGAKKNVYSTGEPKIFYKSSANNEFEDLGEMLIEGEIGETFIGFKHPKTDEFIPAAKFNTEASEKTKSLRASYMEALLSTTRVLGEDGITRFKGEGQFREIAKLSARGVRFNTILDLGAGNIKIDKDGLIDLNLQDDYISAISQDGKTNIISIDEIPTSEALNKANLLAYEALSKAQGLRPDGVKSRDVVQEERLDLALVNFMTTLGFELSILEDYKKNYNTKYGQDPDIKAIADMANKVVAISKGEDVTKELLEEVAHLAIELYADSSDIYVQMANVHLTPEYSEFAEQYRSKYSSFYEGVQLEEQVRKEILGKILAKSLKDNFSTEGKSETTTGLIEGLREMWNRFTAFLKSRFKPYHQKTLDSLNKEIARNVFSQNIDIFKSSIGNKNFFYDLDAAESKGIIDKLKVAKESMYAIFQTVLEQNTPNTETLNKIGDGMRDADMLLAVQAMSGTTLKQLKAIGSKVNEALNKGEVIPSKMSTLFTAIDGNIIDTIRSVKSDLEKTKNIDDKLVAQKKDVIKGLEEVLRLYDDVKPNMDKDLQRHAENIIKEALRKNPSLTEDQIEEMVESVKAGIKDINSVQRLFGIASTSSNLFMNYLQHRVSKMSFDTNFEVKELLEATYSEIIEKGLDKYQRNIIQLQDGKDTGYYLGPLDLYRFNKDVEGLKVAIINELTGIDPKKIEKDIKEGASINVLLKDDKLKSEFDTIFKNRLSDLLERPRLDSYYAERDARYKNAGISDYTIATLTNISQERAVLNTPFMVNGRLDRYKMTESDKSEEADFNVKVEAIKSPYNHQGEIYDNLEYVRAADLTEEQKKAKSEEFDASVSKGILENFEDVKGQIVILKPGVTKAELSDEARAALDFSNLNLLYRLESSNNEKGGITEDFINELDKKQREDSEEAYKWLTSNSSMVLNEKYYNQLEDTTSYAERAQKYIDTIEDTAVRDNHQLYLDSIKKMYSYRNNLLKRYRNKKNPLEVDAHHMLSSTRDKIKKLEEDIQEAKLQLKVPGIDEDTVESSIRTERKPNDSFEKSLIEYGGVGRKIGRSKRLEFMLKHVSERNIYSYNEFSRSIDNYYLGVSSSIKTYYKRYVDQAIAEGRISPELEKQALENTDPAQSKIARDEIKLILQLDFAQSHLASYFIKYEPQGLSELQSAFKTGAVQLSDLFDKDKKDKIAEKYDILNYFDITPDYTWLKEIDANKTINKKFNVNGTYRQPSLSKYFNKEFFTRYGIDQEDFLSKNTDISDMVATKNKEEFELLQKMIGVRKTVIEQYGDKGRSNPYLRPQITKSGVENISTLDAKEFIRGVIKNRPDDKDYGEQIEGVNVRDIGAKLVPKYYQNAIEDPTELTQNVLYAQAMDLKQSVGYKHKKIAEKDLKAIEFAIQKQSWIEAGKPGQRFKRSAPNEASQYAAWSKEYIEHKLYGINQTKQLTTQMFGKDIDLTRVINKFQGLVRFSNLAFNPFVDGTSFTTGIYNNAVSRFVKDYYSTDAADRGNKLVVSMMSEYFRESGKMNKRSTLNHLMEIFNLEGFEGKLDNSAFGRGVRFAADSAYKMSKEANLPVGPRNLLTILTDYRWIPDSNGNLRLYTYSNYFARRKNEDKGIEDKTIELEFKKYADDSFYDNFTIIEGKIQPNEKFIAKYPENTKDIFKGYLADISNKARTLCEYADGALNETDQVSAQRDVITNIFMMHRGWLPLLLSRFFKSKQYSFSLGKEEEGTVNTLGRLIYNFATTKDKGELVKSLTPLERKNLKRLLVDSSMAASIFILGSLIFSSDDDDEDEDTFLGNLGKYIYIRTAGEISQQQVLTIPSTVIDVLKNPITVMRAVEAINPTEILYDGLTLNLPSLGERIVDTTVLKRYSQMTDIEEKMSSYMHFNSSVLYNLSPENMNSFKGTLVGGWFSDDNE
jgi:hypothetical protein